MYEHTHTHMVQTDQLIRKINSVGLTDARKTCDTFTGNDHKYKLKHINNRRTCMSGKQLHLILAKKSILHDW